MKRISIILLAVVMTFSLYACGSSKSGNVSDGQQNDQENQLTGKHHVVISVKAYGDIKIVDLTIADDKSYEQLNHMLESYGNAQVKKGVKIAKILGRVPQYSVNKTEFKRIFERSSKGAISEGINNHKK